MTICGLSHPQRDGYDKDETHDLSVFFVFFLYDSHKQDTTRVVTS